MTLRDLAPCDARLALSVDRFVRKEIELDWRGASLVVALSGGADSTALLALLCALREYRSLTLTAAHLDHALRVESTAEALAARELCRMLNVPFVEERCDVAALAQAEGMGLEEAGRQARYAFLEQVRERGNADFIVTGHHVDDLAEDVLLRLTRGAGWPGLGGMCARTENRVLRPLLLTDKATLVAFLRRQGLPWSEDASNTDNMFRRNRIRHNVLPLLLAENPNWRDAVRKLWRQARLDEAYWDELIRPVLRSAMQPAARPGEALARTGDSCTGAHMDPHDYIQGADKTLLPLAELRSLPKAARLRLCAAAVREWGGQPRADTLFEMEKAIEQRRHGKTFYFLGGVEARLTAEGVCVGTKRV